MKLTYERLIEVFGLDWAGWFYNRFSRGRAKGGERAGYQDVHGYRRICLDGVKYYEHHLVWFYVHGEWPDELDHIDGNRANNAPENLRLCTRTQNNCNSQQATGRSGLRGAYLDSRSHKWFSKIQFGDVVTYLGSFDTAEEAHEAFEAAAKQLHGKFYKPPIEDENQWQ